VHACKHREVWEVCRDEMTSHRVMRLMRNEKLVNCIALESEGADGMIGGKAEG
jgi:hypothetical protein